MSLVNDNLLGQFFVPFLVWFFFIFGLAGLAVGAGLLVFGNGMKQIFGASNRWISTRRNLNLRWTGLLFVFGGAYPLFKLLQLRDQGGISRLLGSAVGDRFAVWMLEAAGWILMAGNLIAIVVGLLMLFSPAVLESISARFRSQQVQQPFENSEEKMYLTLDRLIVSHPRLAGLLISTGAAIVVVQFGLVLNDALR